MKAKVIDINPGKEHLTVEYEDPYGHGSHTIGIRFDHPFTRENLIKSVMRYYPKEWFDNRHQVIESIHEIKEDELYSMIGVTIDAEEPNRNTSNFPYKVY